VCGSAHAILSLLPPLLLLLLLLLVIDHSQAARDVGCCLQLQGIPSKVSQGR
jgi:hypothetical protein